jgi:hypothetical protein
MSLYLSIEHEPCQILVLANEENDVIPKIPVKVATQAIPDTLRFADVDRRPPGFSISPTQEIDA